MISLVYVPDAFEEHILNSNDTGQNMYEDYVTARINGHVILWRQRPDMVLAEVSWVCNKTG